MTIKRKTWCLSRLTPAHITDFSIYAVLTNLNGNLENQSKAHCAFRKKRDSEHDDDMQRWPSSCSFCHTKLVVESHRRLLFLVDVSPHVQWRFSAARQPNTNSLIWAIFELSRTHHFFSSPTTLCLRGSCEEEKTKTVLGHKIT